MVDFEYYCDEFCGTVIEYEWDFAQYAAMAEEFVRGIICGEPDFEEEDIICCICAVAEVYAQMPQNGDCGCMDDMLMHAACLYLPPMLICSGR